MYWFDDLKSQKGLEHIKPLTPILSVTLVAPRRDEEQKSIKVSWNPDIDVRSYLSRRWLTTTVSFQIWQHINTHHRFEKVTGKCSSSCNRKDIWFLNVWMLKYTKIQVLELSKCIIQSSYPAFVHKKNKIIKKWFHNIQPHDQGSLLLNCPQSIKWVISVGDTKTEDMVMVALGTPKPSLFFNHICHVSILLHQTRIHEVNGFLRIISAVQWYF